MQKHSLSGLIAGLAASAIWGGMYVVSKYALDFIPPFTLLWLRYVTALCVLYPLAARQQKAPLTRDDQRIFLLIGFVGYVVSVGLQFIGTRLSSAHNGAIITSASPAFILLFAWLMLGERLTTRKLFSVLLAQSVMSIDALSPLAATGAIVGTVLIITVAVGLVESLLARLAFRRAPLLLTTSFLLCLFALLVAWKGGRL